MKKLCALLVAAFLVVGCSTQPSEINSPVESSPAGATSNGNFEPLLSASFDAAWSTDVSRKEMIETALFKLFRDIDSIRNDNCEFRPIVFAGEPLLEEHHYLLEGIADGMVASFCDYLTEDIPVIGGSYDFAKEVIAEQGYDSDEFGGNCGFDLQQDYASACAAYKVAWTGISLGSVRDGVPFVEERRLTIAAHELFHIVHDQINPNGAPGLSSCRSYSCQGPVWFFEGAGEFFGRAMTQYLGLQNYATFVPTDRSGYFIDGEYLSDLDFLTKSRNLAGGVENYYSGQIAMEFLIANIGLFPVMRVWENMNSGMIFPDAFQDSIGLELEEFYKKFKTLHLRLYEEGGHCDSTLGCPAWNKSEQQTDWYNDTSMNSESSQGNLEGHSHSEGLNPSSHGISEECLSVNEQWWANCTELELAIPKSPENSNHGQPTDFESIPLADSCKELGEVRDSEGWAKSFEAREIAGADQAFVSTQYYAALRHLDQNLDGVICSAQAPE